MEVYKYHSNITQKGHGASRNYGYVLDVSGDMKGQYTRFRDYLQAVLDTNPGSRCIVTTRELELHPSPNPRFHYMFYCLNASKEGFLNGCRPFIGIICILNYS